MVINQKMFECEYCGNKLRTKSSLKVHQKDAKFCLELRGIIVSKVTPKKLPEEYQKEAEKIADEKGGKVLSTYTGHTVKMEWMCDQAHIFTSHLYNVRRGRWCLLCKRPRITIEKCQELAEKNGGKCLSENYQTDIKLEWECALGHQWFALYENVCGRKSWCQKCWFGRTDPIKHQKYYQDRENRLEKSRELAKSKGGECLSQEYIGASHKLSWQCKRGHKWLAKYEAVVNRGTWCPKCLHKNEEKCREIFEQILGIEMPKTRSIFSNPFLELDGYSENCGPNGDIKIGFEYQGEQHFRPVPRFYNHDYDEQVIRDEIKRNECEILGINLIEIPYTVTNKQDFIKEKLTYIFDNQQTDDLDSLHQYMNERGLLDDYFSE